MTDKKQTSPITMPINAGQNTEFH